MGGGDSIGAGVGSLIGGIVGNSRASGDQQQANELAYEAYKQMASMGVPPDMAKQVILEQYKSAGTLTPELEQAINLGPSAVAGIQEDPSLRNAQMAALQQYQQAGQTGQTAQDQLNNLKMQNQINSDNKSRQQSIIQQAQQRGESGGGASLAAQLLNAQGSANSENEQGLQLAAQANQARMAALSNAAGLGGQLRSQDFNVNQTKANAADQFQRFNVQNQQQVANTNVGAKNQAQAANLSNAQQLSNANIANTNQEALRQNQGQMDTWNADMRRRQAIAQAASGQSQNMQKQADQIRNQATQFGAGLGGLVGSGAQAAFGMPSGGGGAPSGAMPTGSGTSMAGGAGDEWPQGVGNTGEAFAAHGGMIKNVPHYDSGGQIQDMMKLAPLAMMLLNKGGQIPMEHGYGYGGQIADQRFNTGGSIANPEEMCYDSGGPINAERGILVPGQAVAPGDSYRNDMVPAIVSPDEIVIPRSITMKEDAPERAKEFVKGILASKKHNR